MSGRYAEVSHAAADEPAIDRGLCSLWRSNADAGELEDASRGRESEATRDLRSGGPETPEAVMLVEHRRQTGGSRIGSWARMPQTWRRHILVACTREA